MTRRRKLAPFQQGNLDGLCGVYAIINAVRLALGQEVHLYSAETWQDLFYTLMLAAEDQVGAAKAAACGIYTKPLMKLLRAAARHMADEHDLRLSYSRLLKRGERPDAAELLNRLNVLTGMPDTAILISLTGHLDHWTVLKNVRDSSLVLFDSSQFARVNLANCRMSYEPPLPGRREHIIHRTAVVRISIANLNAW